MLFGEKGRRAFDTASPIRHTHNTKSMNRTNKLVIIAGLIGLFILLLLLLLVKRPTSNLENQPISRNTLYLLADDIRGIEEGTSILIQGDKVGQVEAISQANNRELLEISFRDAVSIQKSAQFFSITKSTSEERQIKVVIISERGPFYENGDTVKTGLLVESSYGQFDSLSIEALNEEQVIKVKGPSQKPGGFFDSQ